MYCIHAAPTRGKIQVCNSIHYEAYSNPLFRRLSESNPCLGGGQRFAEQCQCLNVTKLATFQSSHAWVYLQSHDTH